MDFGRGGGYDKNMGKTAKPRLVAILLYGDMQLLDAAGPADVFTQANRRAGGNAYEVMFVGAARSVSTIAGLTLAAQPLPGTRRAVHTLIVPGGRRRGLRAVLGDVRLMRWMTRSAETAQRVVSVCTGAFILAAMGLLDGRHATTHWAWLETMARRFPEVRVEREALFVEDGRIWTSAGVSSGVDLALALVARDLGHDLALQVARDLVLHLVRPGGQSQFAEPLALQARAGPDLARLIAWLNPRLDDDTTVAQMAAAMGMSERSFHRRCVASFGMAPGRLLAELRLDQARTLLCDRTTSVQAVARRCGFSDPAAFSSAFARRFGAAPTAFRRAFAGVSPTAAVSGARQPG